MPDDIVKALVLSGGGARGAFEAGAIQSLKSFGPYDVICGTSAGAINGSFVAQDAYEKLDEVWHNIQSHAIIQYVDVVKHTMALLRDIDSAMHDPFPRKIGDLLKALGEWMHIGPKAALLHLLGAVEPLPITTLLTTYLDYRALSHMLIVTATNITQQSADTFFFAPPAKDVSSFASKQKVGTARYPLNASTYVRAVQASTSIPGAFPPVELSPDGRTFQYVDGGVANNTPIGMAVDAGASEITVVFVEPESTAPPTQPITNMVQLGLACLTVMQQKILEDDLKLARVYNAALDSPATVLPDKRKIDIYVVRPTAPLSVSVLDFDKQTLLNSAYEAGRVAGASRVKV